MSESLFDNVPVEEDTRIIHAVETHLGDWPVLHQRWTWDGIQAESLIFLADDVAHLDDQALLKILGESPLVGTGGHMTVARERDGYTFVNFNFEY